MLYELNEEYELELGEFKTALQATGDSVSQLQSPADTAITETKLSKADKIKKSKQAKQAKSNNNYWVYAFTDYVEDEEFKTMFEDVKSEVDKLDNVTYIRKRTKKGYALGIDKMVIVNPLYIKINEASDNPVKLIASEEAQLALQNKIEESAEATGVEVVYLQNSSLQETESDKFNDLSLLNNWISEKLSHEDEDLKILNSTNEYFNQLSEKYKVENFAWVGVLSVKEREYNKFIKIFLSLFFPPYLPFAIVDAADPDYSTYFFTLVANAKTGNFDMQYFNVTSVRDASSIQKSNLYYIFQQINQPPQQ